MVILSTPQMNSLDLLVLGLDQKTPTIFPPNWCLNDDEFDGN